MTTIHRQLRDRDQAARGNKNNINFRQQQQQDNTTKNRLLFRNRERRQGLFLKGKTRFALPLRSPKSLPFSFLLLARLSALPPPSRGCENGHGGGERRGSAAGETKAGGRRERCGGALSFSLSLALCFFSSSSRGQGGGERGCVEASSKAAPRIPPPKKQLHRPLLKEVPPFFITITTLLPPPPPILASRFTIARARSPGPLSTARGARFLDQQRINFFPTLSRFVFCFFFFRASYL